MRLQVTLTEDNFELPVNLMERKLDIPITLTEEDMEFSVEFEEAQIIIIEEPVPIYEGAYTATPRVTEQSFDTDDKKLVDDFKVLSIPRSDVSNPYGGTTVTIG